MRKNKSKEELGKYRSHFEVEVAAKMPSDGCYECSELHYEIPATQHKYIADFTTVAQDGHEIYWETKGRFRTAEESKKYLYVKQSNPDIDLRFIIQSKNTLMPRSAKTTMYDWLKKNGFLVYVYPNLPNFKKL